MLITWCWQSDVKFPGQNCLIVQVCQMCHVPCKGNSHTSNTRGLQYYESVSNIYLSQKASLGNEYIWVWWVHDCSVYYSVKSNYQVSSKGLAYLISLFIHPPLGSPGCSIRLCWLLCNCAHEPNSPNFAENSFFAIYVIPSPYSLVCFCLGNINQTSPKTEGLGTYGNALVGITFQNYLDSSSSCCVYTQRLPREGAMRGNGMLGAGQGWGVPQKNPKTAGVWQVTNYMLSTNHAAKGFPIKILSFACPYSEGEEPKRKMFAETETRVTWIPPNSEWMLDRLIFSPGCLNSSDLKVSLTSFTGGGGGGGGKL